MAIRPLDTATLDAAAKHYATLFIKDEASQHNGKAKFDRTWVMQQFYAFTYKDEFDYLIAAVKSHLGPAALADFEARIKTLLTDHPRSDEVFHALLEEKRPAGYQPKSGG